MILPGTYQNGFAPRDGEPLFPELWRGCVGSWNPGLGPTGLTLRDWSAYKNHGTLTNMDAGTDWVASQGRYALDFDGVNDFVDCSGVSSPSVFSMVGWFSPTDTTGAEMLAVQRSHQSTASLMRTQWFFNGVNIHCRVFSGLNENGWRGVIASNVVATAWKHYGFVYNGGTNIKCFVNGIEQSVTTESGGAAFAAINTGSVPLVIGAQNTSGVPANHYSGRCDDIAIYNRALSPNEIRLLASRRGIAYEMAPRSWTSQQIAAYRSRYYSQVIGSGVV